MLPGDVMLPDDVMLTENVLLVDEVILTEVKITSCMTIKPQSVKHCGAIAFSIKQIRLNGYSCWIVYLGQLV